MLIYTTLFILFLVLVFLERIKNYFQHNSQGWKVRKESHKKIIYAEKINGKWNEIQIEAHINIGTFEPLFRTKDVWYEYPAWAQDRHTIMKRVTQQFPLKNEIALIGSDEE